MRLESKNNSFTSLPFSFSSINKKRSKTLSSWKSTLASTVSSQEAFIYKNKKSINHSLYQGCVALGVVCFGLLQSWFKFFLSITAVKWLSKAVKRFINKCSV